MNDYLHKSADISKCGKYRYSLSRVWEYGGRTVLFIMLNPSTADSDNDDSTIKKCVKYAKSWGFHDMTVVNLFPFRTKDPEELKAVPKEKLLDRQITMHNESIIYRKCSVSEIVICAWSNHGNLHGMSDHIKGLLTSYMKSRYKLHYLKMNNTKEPAHPLYLKDALTPIRWDTWNEVPD